MSNSLVERLGDALGQSGEQIDPQTHIAGLHDHGLPGRVLDLRFVLGGKAGGADDVTLAGFRRQRREGNRRRRRR